MKAARTSRTTSLVLLLWALGSACACGGLVDAAGAPHVRDVGPEGGTVARDGASVEIPEGALAETTTIEVQEAPDAPAGHVGMAYRFLPEGQVFALSVTLRLSFDADALPQGLDASALRLATVVDGAWKEVAGSTVDVANSQVAGQVTHFSSFAVWMPCTEAGPCFVGAWDDAEGCVYTPRDCNDDDACTVDSCAPATGLCEHAAIEGCKPECLQAREWETYPAGDVRCRAYTYNALGLLLTDTYDPDCDGDFDDDGGGHVGYCDHRTYDAQGRMLTRSHDRECDGEKPDQCYTWTYDDASHTVEEVQDSDCATPPEFVTTRTYDDQDRLVRERVQAGFESGFSLQCTELTYDAFDNVLETRLDTDCDGSGESCWRDTFDAAGVYTGSQADDGCDGVPDRNCKRAETVVLESGETQITHHLDNTCDGIDDTCITRRSNARGLETWVQVDRACDGVIDECREWVFDANGSLLSATIDEPCDGTPKLCAETYTLDANGVKVAWADDPECTGQALNCYTLALDEAGRPGEQWSDDCQGHVGGCILFEYDAHGNLITKKFGGPDTPCGAGATTLEHHEYQCGEDLPTGPYPYEQVTLYPTDPPEATGTNDVAAFVPDYCSSTTPVDSPDVAGMPLDCPGLEASRPCTTFFKPPSIAASLTPAVPMLQAGVWVDAWTPEGCACDHGLSVADDGGDFSARHCRSLLVLDAEGLVVIDSPQALAARFAPVETAAEALAFVELIRPGVMAFEQLVTVHDATDLAEVGFPLNGLEKPVCRDAVLHGTEVYSTGDGFLVRAIVFNPSCTHAGLRVLWVSVSTAGVVTAGDPEELCWYVEQPCYD